MKLVYFFVCIMCFNKKFLKNQGFFIRNKLAIDHLSMAFSLSLALHRGPPGSRGPVIPPLLSLPPPPRGRGPVWGGLGPRFGPYGRGWWGINAEPPVPGPSHGPSRGGFHKEQRHPRRLKSWSLVKNTCPPKDGPQVKEGEVHFFYNCIHLIPCTPRVTLK